MSFFANLERFVNAGYELRVVPERRGFHASVGDLNNGHNYVAASIDEALRGLDFYVSDREPHSSVMNRINSLDQLASRIAGIVDRCAHKEPGELTAEETTALALFGGAEMEFTGTGVRPKNPIGLQKINGKWIVCERRTPRRSVPQETK